MGQTKKEKKKGKIQRKDILNEDSSSKINPIVIDDSRLSSSQ